MDVHFSSNGTHNMHVQTVSRQVVNLKWYLIHVNQGSCDNGARLVFYEENDYCLIKNGSNFNLNGWNITYNEDVDIINQNNIKDDQVLNYFVKSNLEKPIAHINTTLNLSQSDDFYYVDSNQILEKCRFIDDIRPDAMIIIICIPILYLITMLILICIYCKYKKITIKYEKLKEEVESSGEFKSNEI